MNLPKILRRSLTMLVVVVAALLAGSPALAQRPPRTTSPGKQVVADRCSVKFIRNVNIPAEVEGKLIEMNVEEGMDVVAGDVLAVIDDTSAKLTVALKKAEETEAMLNADNDVNVQDARNTLELAEAEAESHKKLYEEQAISYWEVKKKMLEAVRGSLKIDLAEMQMKIAKAQYIGKRNEREIAEYEEQRRRVFAPFDGYIENRIAQQGEWVQGGSPIATLVQLDRVRVEGVVDALAFPGRVRAGLPVTVRVFTSNDQETPVVVAGKIGFVGSELDLSHRVRIWVDIDNQKDSSDAWIIKPGMNAEIIFE
ncbi:efflux RND transporter periplasmic adaptor subunit [Allorhodopirellula heiligendammensis]|uniref:Efflux pump membrane fusion protein n=1 Tax=Allorhodopirellula heiligendammensis TaxID=2714739 RepID=A0A5C6BH25_9BACT|nr:HlyD family efflux transporter periplasmic adaptor subunit [Allorhodopirellula heiligendammensis]TWU09764.1 putative efflux pump membrane fusion protein [Allorhodopirellula heiligendammensis]